MTPDELFADFTRGFRRRKFSAGLLMALIDFFVDLEVPDRGYKDFGDVLDTFPQVTEQPSGGRYNTLVLMTGSGARSIRPAYNRVERELHVTHKRFDYPSCAPHATQAWSDYVHWLDALASYDRSKIDELRERVLNFVLEALPSHEFDPRDAQVEPPLFQLLLDEFELSAQPGEKPGAAYQGLVFGFLRADNPHLQVEIDSVRTGSRRRQRVGDVDAWEGRRLAITAEVKQFEVSLEHVPSFEKFADAVTRRSAIGMVVTRGFASDARGAVADLGLHPLDHTDLSRVVALWDPMKQRTAVSSMVYYVEHVERNMALRERLREFLNRTREAMNKVGLG